MRRTITMAGALVGASLTLALPALGATQATGVTVTAGKPAEFKFTLSKKSVVKGKVTFSVTLPALVTSVACVAVVNPGNS